MKEEFTCLSVGEEQVLLGAGDGLEHHLKMLHIVRQGTLRDFCCQCDYCYDKKFVDSTM